MLQNRMLLSVKLIYTQTLLDIVLRTLYWLTLMLQVLLWKTFREFQTKKGSGFFYIKPCLL